MASRKDAAVAAKPRCDICNFRHDWKGFCLYQCRSCGVYVHGECYGLMNAATGKTFQCWACQAVGKEIQGQTMKSGKVKKIVQKKRPVECALCAVNDGVHAMHALYRDCAPDGKQLILPAGGTLPQRLAWVHSLCALTVNSHRGTRGGVYGCDEDGDWEANEPAHHFVMCGLSGEKDKEYIKILADHRKELSCYICGDREKSAGRYLRIPLQCCAGDDDEFIDFKKYHLSVGVPCTQAMHVGCARWGTKADPPKYKRLYFYPGTDNDEFVTEIFCDLHARQIPSQGIKKAAVDTKSRGGLLDDSSKPTSAAALPTYASSSLDRRASSYATAGTSRGKEGSATKKPGTKVSSVTKEAPLRRHSDVLKKATPNKSKPLSGASVKAKPTTQTVPVTASIPRKHRDAVAGSEVKKSGGSSSHSSGVVTSASTTSRTSPALTRGKFTSPIAKHCIVPSHMQKKPPKGSAVPHTLTSGAQSVAFTPPPVKRRRIMSISEEKMSEDMIRDRDLGGIRINIDSMNRGKEKDDDIWMSDDVQGLVETEELPPIDTLPEGENPWAYLWEPDAPPFKIELIACAERRNIKGLTDASPE